jgi:hypothetical protein
MTVLKVTNTIKLNFLVLYFLSNITHANLRVKQKSGRSSLACSIKKKS